MFPDEYPNLYGSDDLFREEFFGRPATEETVAELRAHSARHRSYVRNGEGFRYAGAHALASVGLFLAAVAHEFLDRLDKRRGYR